MKSAIVAITIAVLALPIYAQQQGTRPNTTTTTLSVPTSQEQTDSPLVRAAKATGRLGKKPGYVITNDTLLRVGSGHMSLSTSTGAALPAAPLPKDPTAPAQQPRTDAKSQVDAAVRLRNAQQANSDYLGENLEQRHEDPAMQEHQMQQAPAPKPPQD
jgi:hypothetical protein